MSAFLLHCIQKKIIKYIENKNFSSYIYTITDITNIILDSVVWYTVMCEHFMKDKMYFNWPFLTSNILFFSCPFVRKI